MRTKRVQDNLIFKFCRILSELDRMVFPESPIKRIEIIKQKPKAREKGSYFHYVPKEQDKTVGEHYEIFTHGINEIFSKERSIKRHIALAKSRDEIEKLPLFNEEELLLAIVAHEIRHRVQHNLSINLFSAEDAERIDDPHFRLLIEFVKWRYEVEPPKGDYKREFDAKIIEYWVAKEWHEGNKDLSKIAEIIKLEPKYFRKLEEEPSSSFYLFFFAPLPP